MSLSNSWYLWKIKGSGSQRFGMLLIKNIVLFDCLLFSAQLTKCGVFIAKTNFLVCGLRSCSDATWREILGKVEGGIMLTITLESSAIILAHWLKRSQAAALQPSQNIAVHLPRDGEKHCAQVCVCVRVCG